MAGAVMFWAQPQAARIKKRAKAEIERCIDERTPTEDCK
jgi:hypothetical protein